MHEPWHLGRLAALDFEASDKERETARAVSCALILCGGGEPTEPRTWLINPGIPQEPGAIAVHGLTDEYLAANGMPAKQAIQEIAEAVAAVVREGIPLVGHNLGSFDLNLLSHEIWRHLGETLPEFISYRADIPPRVIDTMVLDRHAAPYRRRVSEDQGPYQMRTTAEVYGLKWDEKQAHGAEYDALKSAQAAWRMSVIAHQPRAKRPAWVQKLSNWRGPYDRFDDLACDIDELHRRQTRWAAEQAASLQEWLRSEKAGEKRDPAAVIDGSWPLAPFPAAVTS